MRLAIFIGRFAPLHNGHCAMLQYAYENYDHTLVIVGSAEQSPNLRTPWSATVRMNLIRQSMGHKNMTVTAVRDYPYPYHNPLWVKAINNCVDECVFRLCFPANVDARKNLIINLLGKGKDAATAEYLKFFPQYPFDSGPKITQQVSSSEIRELYFRGHAASITTWISKRVPAEVAKFLERFKSFSAYKDLNATSLTADANRARFGIKPNLTTDCMVIGMTEDYCHAVLLVRRGQHPGKGLLALPGGYLEPGLTLLENAVKELKEETGLELSAARFSKPHIFDAVHRSSSHRTVTAVFSTDLMSAPTLKAGDDAAEAFWVPTKGALNSQLMFHDDHFHILETLLNETRL